MRLGLERRRGAVVVALALLGAWLGAGDAVAQAPPSGVYEAFSPSLGVPVGALADAAHPVTPRWLKVTSEGAVADVTLEPGGSLRWQLRYGPHGLEAKRATVDGALWTESTFERDERGHLKGKRVTGPGAGDGLQFSYRTDAAGRPHERMRVDERAQLVTAGGGRATWEWTRTGCVVRSFWNGELVRIDTLDGAGRQLRLDVGHPADGPLHLGLRFRRGAAGRLIGVDRLIPGKKPAPVVLGRPDPDLTPALLDQLPPLVERHEVLMLLGEPVTHTVDRAVSPPTVTDRYTDGCWLNQPDTVTYDPSGLLTGTSAACICGFCVAAELAPAEPDVLQEDRHWTRGPWVRLDGRVDVTADHRVMTPTGPRAAGALRPGDLVLDAGGASRALRSVERLPPGERRLGVNLRTRSGTFRAGGLLFESEAPRPCDGRDR